MKPAERVSAIRERLEKATKGPWYQGSHAQPEPPTPDAVELSRLLCCFEDEGEPRFWDWEGDGEFVANAREDLPWALERIEKLEAALRCAMNNLDSDAEACSCCEEMRAMAEQEEAE